MHPSDMLRSASLVNAKHFFESNAIFFYCFLGGYDSIVHCAGGSLSFSNNGVGADNSFARDRVIKRY